MFAGEFAVSLLGQETRLCRSDGGLQLTEVTDCALTVVELFAVAGGVP